jgi:hypothetical protein
LLCNIDRRRFNGLVTFAYKLGVSFRSVSNWTAAKLIPYYRLDGVMRFDLPAVRKALERFKNRVADPFPGFAQALFFGLERASLGLEGFDLGEPGSVVRVGKRVMLGITRNEDAPFAKRLR